MCKQRDEKKNHEQGKGTTSQHLLRTCLQHLPLGSPVAPSCQLRDLLVFPLETSQWLPNTMNKTQLFSMAHKAPKAWPRLLLLASALLQSYRTDLIPGPPQATSFPTPGLSHTTSVACNGLLFTLLMAVPLPSSA